MLAPVFPQIPTRTPSIGHGWVPLSGAWAGTREMLSAELSPSEKDRCSGGSSGPNRLM